MDREGEYAATLLCVGGPPDIRPPRDLVTGMVDHTGMRSPARGNYSTWATKVREYAVEQGWMDSPANELFEWITGFLAWYDNGCVQPEERYHG